MINSSETLIFLVRITGLQKGVTVGVIGSAVVYYTGSILAADKNLDLIYTQGDSKPANVMC